MNAETFQIYEGQEEIEAAEARGEPLIHLKQEVIEAFKDVEQETLKQVMDRRLHRLSTRR